MYEWLNRSIVRDRVEEGGGSGEGGRGGGSGGADEANHMSSTYAGVCVPHYFCCRHRRRCHRLHRLGFGPVVEQHQGTEP